MHTWNPLPCDHHHLGPLVLVKRLASGARTSAGSASLDMQRVTHSVLDASLMSTITRQWLERNARGARGDASMPGRLDVPGVKQLKFVVPEVSTLSCAGFSALISGGNCSGKSPR